MQDATAGHQAQPVEPAIDRSYFRGDVAELEDLDEGECWYLYRVNVDGRAIGVYDAKGSGPIDVEWVRAKYAAGDYVVRTRVRTEKGWQYKRTIAFGIDAPQGSSTERTLAVVPAGAPATPGPPTSGELFELREQIAHVIAKLDARAEPPRAGGMDIEGFAKLLHLARELSPPASEPSLDALLGVFDKGFDAASRAGSAGEYTGILREALQLARETIKQRAAERARRDGLPATTAPAAPGLPATIDGTTQLATLLVRAAAKQLTPAQLADILEDLLSEDELGNLRLATTDALLEQLATVPGFPPALRTESKAYLDEVLRLLRTPVSESEDQRS